MPLIAPSILTADFLHLQSECEMLNESKADWFHLDVMDGRFVPNISFGMSIIKQIRKTTSRFFDVHLMILEPEKYVEEFKDAGANSLTVHLEACPHLHRNIQHIKSLEMKAAVAINPATPIFLLQDIITDLDMVLVMSVNPGFGGQSFIPHTIEKIKELKTLINKTGSLAKIEVDGGISLQNASEIINAGADVLVVGNAIFSSQNPKETIEKLKNSNSGDIIVYGGATLVSSLINADLIDEYYLIINPVALGKGLAIFKKQTNLKMANATSFPCGIVVCHYRK